MTKITETTKNKLLDEYVNLNAKQKNELHEAFDKAFSKNGKNSKGSTFYRKLNNPDQLYNHEKLFFAEKLKTTVNELFPS